MECIPAPDDSTAKNAKHIIHRMMMQQQINTEYFLGIDQFLGLVQEIRGPVPRSASQPLGIVQTVTPQHATPHPVTQPLGITQTVVFAGGIGGGGGGGGGDSNRLIFATIDGRIPGGGEAYFSHDGDISHSGTPLVLDQNFQLIRATVAVNTADAGNDYTVRLYDQSGPTLIGTVVALTSGNVSASASGLSLTMNAGSYGFTLERTSGSGKSDFLETVLHFVIEPV